MKRPARIFAAVATTIAAPTSARPRPGHVVWRRLYAKWLRKLPREPEEHDVPLAACPRSIQGREHRPGRHHERHDAERAGGQFESHVAKNTAMQECDERHEQRRKER